MKQNERKQKFSIRKLSVGVASVTIASFMMGGAVIAAETTTAETTAKATTGKLRPEMDYRMPLLGDEDKIRLKEQIVWADFSKAENLSEKDKSLTEDTVLTIEPQPGLVFTAKVKKLRPFNASETYKAHVDADANATAKDKASYDPNRKNYSKKEETGKLVPAKQSVNYSNLGISGFKFDAPVTLATKNDGDDAGVVFEITATYNGKSFKPSMIVTDGEEQSNSGREWTGFVTDGTPWELVANIGQVGATHPKHMSADEYNNAMGGLAYKGFGKYLVADNLGLGTQYFGGYSNNIKAKLATPLAMTHDVSQLELYIASRGKQASMFGFVIMDNGDASDSYHGANHFMGANKDASQPYLGTTLTDADYDLEGKDWFKDDTTATADEGVKQLMGDQAILGKDGKTYYYKYQLASDKTYQLPIIANTGQNKVSYVRGWLDTNNDGEFSDDEASEILEVTNGKATPTHNLVFKNQPQILDTKIEKIGMRVRTALNPDNIASPTGSAFSGEVEDFEIQVVHPPRGTKETTTGNPGEKQTATVKFNAYAKQEYSDTIPNEIDTTKNPVIVKADGTLVQMNELEDGYYVVPGEGKYKITGTGKYVDVEFVPEKGFFGQAKGIGIRRQDTNGLTSEWNNEKGNVNTQRNTMDGLYIPIVNQIEKTEDLQGLAQSIKPSFGSVNPVEISATNQAHLVDASGNSVDKMPAMKDGKPVGTYTINPNTGIVTFQPNPDFVGTADPVEIQTTTPSGETVKAIYTPTVTEIAPVAVQATSSDFQGKPQSGTPSFATKDPRVPMKVSATNPAYFVDAEGKPMQETTIDALDENGEEIGTYTIDPATGKVTFTPDPSFTGTPKPALVGAKDVNGTQVTTKYQPTVTPVTPTATPVSTIGLQGAPQTETPVFKAGHKDVAIKGEAYLVDAEGNPATEVPALDKDGNKIGSYKINDKGAVTFTPDPSFTGTPQPAKVGAKDKNGTEVTTTYQPEVTPVTPTATPVSTIGLQGAPQTETPVFKAGHKEVPIKGKAYLVDEKGQPVKEVPALDENNKEIGKYTIDENGAVTFTPDSSFTGTPKPAKVGAKDKNDTEVTTTYQPEVMPVMPTATPVTSSGLQGATQTETPEFKTGHENVVMKVTATNPAYFVDADGNPVKDADGTPVKEVPALDEKGKPIGTYTIDPTTGEVTFDPKDSFTGTPKPARIAAKDANGTQATTTYQPEVTPVTPTGTPAHTSDKQGATQKATPVFEQGHKDVDLKPGRYFVDQNGNKIEATTIPALDEKGNPIGTYTIDPTSGEVTFAPNKAFVGTPKPAVVGAKDINGTQATAEYSPVVTPVTPTATPATSENIQGQPQSGKPVFTPDQGVAIEEGPYFVDAEGNEIKDTTIDAKDENGKKVGTYKIDPTTGEVTFKPNKDFVGTPQPANVGVKDVNGTKVTTTYQPAVTPVQPTAQPDITIGWQGQEQTGKITFTKGNDKVDMTVSESNPAYFVDADGNKIDKPTIDAMKDGKKVGTYTINPKTGEVTFKPNPSFTGTPEPAIVAAKDANGTQAQAEYTPTVKAVTPTGTPAISEGLQGKEQTGKPNFVAGHPDVAIDITAENPAKLVAEDGSLVDTMPAKDEKGNVVGTYTINPKTGVVTFKPNKDFVGTPEPAVVAAKDANGTQATAEYTPTVKAVTPTGTPAISEGWQGQEQKDKPTFEAGHPDVAIDITAENPAKLVVDGKEIEETTIDAMKDGKKVGTYTIDPTTGEVTFKPNPSFTGTPEPAVVAAKDVNGTQAQAEYTPTVKAVEPKADPVISEGLQNLPQSKTPKFESGNSLVTMEISATNPAYFVDAEGKPMTKTIIDALDENGEKAGTYTIAPATGAVTFTPNPDFIGTAKPATIGAKDENGTEATTTYTPTVKPIVPQSEDATSTGPQGQVQTGNLAFIPGHDSAPIDEKVKPVFENGKQTLTIEGEGTYVVDDEGVVTFTPKPQFTGEGTKVTITRKDTNGTNVTATYQATVNPVTPTGQPAKSFGFSGQEQTGQPTFQSGDDAVKMEISETNKAHLVAEDGSLVDTMPAKDAKGNVVGTYTIDPATGIVTFKPNAGFLGKPVPATVEAHDANGTAARATYQPEVISRPVTPDPEEIKTEFVDQDGNPIAPAVDGSENPVTIDDYYVEETITDEKGNTVHIYRRKHTRFLDRHGRPLNMDIDGQNDPLAFDGYYIEDTYLDENGNTIHVYAMQHTSFVDAEGNPLNIDVDGQNDPLNIPGYTVVSTTTDENGNVIHVYEKTDETIPTPNPTPNPDVETGFVDKDGNEIAPSVDGNQPSINVPGYVIVETIVDEDGNTVYVYEEEDKLPTTGAKSITALLSLGGLFTAAGITSLFKRKK